MEITYDPTKYAVTLRERKLDFEDARVIFAGRHATRLDDRLDYGEARFVSAGLLQGRMVVLVWAPRGEARHVISMRHAHEKEAKLWRERMG